MDEQSLLLASIINNPDDCTIRGVYADWLDEHAEKGNGFKQHAKLIRYQCGFSKIVPTRKEITTAVRAQLGVCSNVISIKNVSHTADCSLHDKCLITYQSGCMIVTHGFISGFTHLNGGYAKQWLKYGPILFTMLPIKTVKFTDIRCLFQNTETRKFFWDPDYCETYKQNFPWFDESTSLIAFNSIDEAVTWFNTVAFTWTLNKSKELTKNGEQHA